VLAGEGVGHLHHMDEGRCLRDAEDQSRLGRWPLRHR
jgi:hypothetical protein